MGNFGKIMTGLGVLIGLSYFGKRRMETERSVAKAGGFLGYLKGMGQGFFYGARSILRFR
jgi:hypothetical protein